MERRIAELRDRRTALEGEVNELRETLRVFSEARSRRLGPYYDLLRGAERLVFRLHHVETELQAGETSAKTRQEPNREKNTPSARRPLEPRSLAPAADDDVSEGLLKELYRSLARHIHPDRARDERERLRFTSLLTQVNAAYAAEDRGRLELLAEQVCSALPSDPESMTKRRAELSAQRIASLDAENARLESELGRLQASSAFREYRRVQERDDPIVRTMRDIETRVQGLVADFWDRSIRVEQMTGPAPSAIPPSGSVRVAVTEPSHQSLSREARRFGERLEMLAERAPFQAALTLLAFFGEVAGRPPRSISTLRRLSERYEWMRPKLTGAPRIEEALALLPSGVELGIRRHGRRTRFGLQLADPAVLRGVHDAVGNGRARAIAKIVLTALGPRIECASCGVVGFGFHLFRTHGLDRLHAIVCSHCGAPTESYRTFGAPEGVEALNPWMRKVGIVAEAGLTLAGRRICFQMIADDQRALRARDLLERFEAIYARPFVPKIGSGALYLRMGRELLVPDALIGDAASPRLSVHGGSAADERAMLERIAEEIESRFRKQPVAASGNDDERGSRKPRGRVSSKAGRPVPAVRRRPNAHRG